MNVFQKIAQKLFKKAVKKSVEAVEEAVPNVVPELVPVSNSKKALLKFHSGDHQYPNCNPDGAGRNIVHGTLIFPGLPVADRGIGGPSFFLFLTFKH